MRMLQEYLDVMRIDSAATVLDLGCGTGVVSRTIARRTGFSGRVSGIDRSPYLAAAATQLAKEEGLGAVVEFCAVIRTVCNYRDAVFDAVVAHTLISHVEDPLVVVKEIARRQAGL
jgi:ubiquinone/menaquinone biosynthesis C-methylase UbiE